MTRQSLEVLLDRAGDERIRSDWQLLRDAGLPSRLDHTGTTNAPHVTAIAVPEIAPEVRALAVELLAPLLPVTCRLAGLAVLGERRRVVVRLVEVPDELVAAVLRLKAGTEGHGNPGWLPHVTLAHGLDDADVGRALALLDPSPSLVVAASLRWWNPADGSATTLLG